MSTPDNNARPATAVASPLGFSAPARMTGGDRRRQLVQIAIRLFSQKGFSGTTTKEIAQAAGVNQTILFRHFPTKDALYAAILEHKANEARTEEWLAELRGHAARRDDEALFDALIRRVLEHPRRDHEFYRLMLFSALEGHALAQSFRDKQVRPVYKFLREYIVLRQREGAFRRCDPGVAVRALFGLPSYHAHVRTLFDCQLLSLTDQEVVKSFTRLILKGLRKETTRARRPASKRRRSAPKKIRR